MSIQGLWTNRKIYGDFARNAVTEFGAECRDLYIAVAFFTESDVLELVAEKECNIKLIVRLGFPTSPNALGKLMAKPNIQLRYFSDSSFHPKLYIFDDHTALVGSANLTMAALSTNQEVVVSVDSEDERFLELCGLFQDYWGEARVLTSDVLDQYSAIYSKYATISANISKLDEDIEEEIGVSRFNNIDTGQKPLSKENAFLDLYTKTYQETLAAFKTISDVYLSVGRRKSPQVPVRIEIDSFFSFVREKKALQESWRYQPIGWTTSMETLLKEHIEEWLDTPWHHFDSEICETNYPLIVEVFGSVESIMSSSYEELLDGLCVVHSFHDRLRFFKGGLERLKADFSSSNDETKVRETFCHLIHGKGDPVHRMADVIFDPHYKLEVFGKSGVQELLGWVGNDDLPIVNARTTKVLRYYGFEVTQIA